MKENSHVSDRPLRIPPIAWFLGVGLITAFVAIFIFNVDTGNVLKYGLLALMMGSHFFMHGSHGGHGNQVSHQHDPSSNAVEANKNEHSDHTGGCH